MFKKIAYLISRVVFGLIGFSIGLITILCFKASIEADDNHLVFYWCATILIALLSALFSYLSYKPKILFSPVKSLSRKLRTNSKFIWISILSVLAVFGLFLLVFALGDHRWMEAASICLVMILAPIFLIHRGLGSDRKSVGSQSEPPVDGGGVGTESIAFWRSRNSTVYVLLVCGFFILFSPVMLGTTLFGLVSIFIFQNTTQLIIGLTTLSLGSVMTLFCASSVFNQYRLVRDRNLPLILLDKLGLHYWAASEKIIPWSEVMSVRISYQKGNPILLLELVNPKLYINRFSWWFSSQLWIGLQILKGPETDVLKAIREYPSYQGSRP